MTTVNSILLNACSLLPFTVLKLDHIILYIILNKQCMQPITVYGIETPDTADETAQAI